MRDPKHGMSAVRRLLPFFSLDQHSTNLEFGGNRIPVEANQIRVGSDAERAARADKAAWIPSRHPNSIVEREPIHAGNEGDAVDEREVGPGQESSAGSAYDLSLRGYFDPAADGCFIDAGRHTSQRDGIGDKEAAVDSLGPQHDLQRVGRQMMAIGYETGGETILGELRPQQVGMAGERACKSIAEVGGQGGAGIDGGMNLGRRGVAVTDGQEHPLFRQNGNEFQGIVPVGRNRHHAHEVPGGSLPAIEFGEAGRTNMLPRVRSTGTIFAGDIRTLDMHKRDGMGRDRIDLARLGDRAQSGDDSLLRGGHDGGQISGDTGGDHLAGERDDDIRIYRAGIQIAAEIAVDLEIDEAGRQPRVFPGWARRNGLNQSVLDGDPQRFFTRRIASGYRLGHHHSLGRTWTGCETAAHRRGAASGSHIRRAEREASAGFIAFLARLRERFRESVSISLERLEYLWRTLSYKNLIAAATKHFSPRAGNSLARITANHLKDAVYDAQRMTTSVQLDRFPE